MTDPEFKRAIEEIKLRAPIEEIVGQRVPELRRRGKLYEACCPFHEEKTPSFKVDPTRGSWHCFGACGDGGDVISFVQKSYGVEFMEAVEILAGQTNVEVPRFKGARQDKGELEAGLDILKRAAAYYRQRLAEPDADKAREYLTERGFDNDTSLSFGLGWAPAAGEAFVDWSRTEGVTFDILEKTGLARRNDRGKPYDFFRGRLLFPIRDLRGRTVGFGARRLTDGPNAGPKYINSPESDWFQKGKLIYGLDLAVKEARKNGHLVLMEGYTDVIAAHHQGLTNTAGICGTSTTDQHAKLIHRSGAQRISLVFDGDKAGREAAFKALNGLLPEDYELDVVQLPDDQDPCDVLMSRGPEPFKQALEGASGWFEFACGGLEELHGNALSQAVDRVLALVLRVKAPVHREDLIRRLAERLDMSVETLQGQLALTPEARAAVRDAERQRREAEVQVVSTDNMESAEGVQAQGARPVQPKVRKAWGQIAGALILDSSLMPIGAEWVERCDLEDIRRVLDATLELHSDLDAEINEGTVMTVLGEHPAREIVGKIVHHARSADSPRVLLEGAILYLKRTRLETERADVQGRLAASEISNSERTDLLQRFKELQDGLSNLNSNKGALAPSH